MYLFICYYYILMTDKYTLSSLMPLNYHSSDSHKYVIPILPFASSKVMTPHNQVKSVESQVKDKIRISFIRAYCTIG